MKITEDEVNKRARQQQDQFLACLITAQSALWSSLLTANGIVIGVLSLLAAIRGPSLAPWAVRVFIGALIITFGAMVAILWCFRSERDHYQELLDMSVEPPPDPRELEQRRERETKRTLRIRKARWWLERIGTATIIADLVIVVVIVITGGSNQ